MPDYVSPALLKPHPVAHLVPDMRPGEWKDFCSDIASRGIKVPLEVLDGAVLDGRHRLRAALELGIETVPVVPAPLNGDTAETYILKAAVLRRHLTDDQRAMMAARWKQENKMEPELGQRDEKGQFQPSARCRAEGDSHTGPTRAEAQERFQVSRRKVDNASYVLGQAPALAERVFQGSKRLQAACREVRREKDRARIQQLPPLVGEFNVLVVDPPWPYAREDDPSHRAANPYLVKSLEDLRAFRLPAAPDSCLWLWATNAFLHEAFHLMEIWGFEYKTMLTWAKDKMGLGDWLRGKTEHCLLGIRGAYRLSPGNATTLLNAPRRAHSAKPEEFYTLVEKLCSGAKIDIFPGPRREGWEAWGPGLER